MFLLGEMMFFAWLCWMMVREEVGDGRGGAWAAES